MHILRNLIDFLVFENMEFTLISVSHDLGSDAFMFVSLSFTSTTKVKWRRDVGLSLSEELVELDIGHVVPDVQGE